jgi:hypothetical protein
LNDPRNRFLLFILGLTVGALVSGAIVYLSINKEKSALSVSRGMIEEIASKVSVLLSRKNEKKEEPHQIEHTDLSTRTEKKDTLEEAAPADTIAASNEVVTDSLTADLNKGDEDIVVRKDELIESKPLDVVELSPDKNVKTKADSLLEKASGIKSEKRNTGEKIMIAVEYWRSPINYRGYKLGKNKLVVYGLDTTVPITILKHNGSLFMSYDQNVYRIEPSNDYRAFEKVNDPNILTVFSHL